MLFAITLLFSHVVCIAEHSHFISNKLAVILPTFQKLRQCPINDVTVHPMGREHTVTAASVVRLLQLARWCIP